MNPNGREGTPDGGLSLGKGRLAVGILSTLAMLFVIPTSTQTLMGI